MRRRFGKKPRRGIAFFLGCVFLALVGAETPAVAQPASGAAPGNVGAGQAATAQLQEDEISAQALTRRQLARRILNRPRAIKLLKYHVSGNYEPKSTAYRNVVSAERGNRSWRSYWGHHPNSKVYLKKRMLRGMLKLRTKHGYRFRVTSIAGGRHGSTSLHYAGLAFDVDRVNGEAISHSRPRRGFQNACRALGADEVLGPGYPGHDTHIHCAWY